MSDSENARIDNLAQEYDFIVCGSGSAGLVVAARLAENTAVRVLLLEAGGTDETPDVQEAARWRNNLGSEWDWGFVTEPNHGLHERPMPLSMGQVLGGGSSINAMGWARGHRADWDYFAEVTREPEWRYESVKQVYERLEHLDASEPAEQDGGLLRMTAAQPGDTSGAVLAVIRRLGLPTFDRLNGPLWESDKGGAGYIESRFKDGKRLSLFQDYLAPHRRPSNLTVLQHAIVHRVEIENGRATGIAVRVGGAVHTVRAAKEIVLSLGAINTPSVLMRSGVGDEAELKALSIQVARHLPGVGKGLQDHLLLGGFVWERGDTQADMPYRAVIDTFAKSTEDSPTPDIKCTQIDGPLVMPGQSFADPPKNAMSILPGLVRPRSSGRVRLASTDPEAKPVVETNYLSDPADMKAFVAAVALGRDIASSDELRGILKHEVFTAGLQGGDLEEFVRQNAGTYWHPSCSAQMGSNGTSVVDGRLRVHGIDNLRIPDASVMPRIPISLIMAPCVVIGEKAAHFLREAHKL